MTSHVDEVQTKFSHLTFTTIIVIQTVFWTYFFRITQTSNREKLEIAQHFLLSSPPGQFNEVLTGKE